MRFDTDRQTLSDLNIFPKERGIKSVFDYYNQTQTKGGKDLLLSIMSVPLNDLSEINNRISTIKFLHDNNLYCELDSKDLDAIEYYLKLDKAILKDHIIDSLYNYFSDRIKPSNEYYLISRGLKCLYIHVRNLIDFFENDDIPELSGFLEEFKSEVNRIKYHPDFKSFINKDRKKLNFRQINRFDYLIRKSEKETISKILEFTYIFDCYISLANIAKEKKLGFPTLIETSNPKMKIEGFFHPLIENPVNNDIEFNENENLCFVSGANMAGKSTFLKSIGLCVYLSHIGFPVPAKTLRTPLFHGLYTTINIPDNISKGYSHYYSEVKRVKDITLLIKDRKRVLVIFDELFRGTNVKDAFDATLLITQGFTRIKHSIFFISTHIVEVGKELEKSDSICFKCFESKLNGEQPIYNYKLKNGISSERLGLTILKNERIIELIDEIAENEKKYSC